MTHQTHWRSLLWLALLSLPLMSAFAQDPYQEDWKQIKALLKQDKTRSALEAVRGIETQADQASDDPQFLKALSYELSLRARIEEQADSLTVERLKKEITRAEQPRRAVLQSMLADYYHGYYENNRWRIEDRTEVEVQPEDFQTWDPRAFYRTIDSLYLASVAPIAELTAIPIREFEAMLDTAKESPRYRPSLFDLLAFRAIDYFADDASDLPRPGETFELTAESGFLPLNQFLDRTFQTPDPQDRTYRVLQLYQRLLASLQARDQTHALVDADLYRLHFTRSQLDEDQVSAAYQKALDLVVRRHDGHPAATLAQADLAAEYRRLGQQHDVLDPDGPYVDAWQEAHRICRQAIVAHPNSQGAGECRNILRSLEAKELNVEVEQVNLPQQPFRVLVSHRNLTQLFFRVIRLDERLQAQIEQVERKNRYDREAVVKLLRQQRAVESWSVDLPTSDDYYRHRVEIAVPALPVGRYFLLSGDSEDFALAQHGVAFVQCQVSNLSYLHQRLPNDQHVLYLRDRQTGAPLTDVEAKVYRDRDYRPLESSPDLTLRTDAQGRISFEAGNRNRWARVVFTQGDDRLETERLYLMGDPYRDSFDPEEDNRRVSFFTDRAIYRPGQTVYFKGVMTRKLNPNRYEAAAEQEVTVQFLDVNRQEVSTATFTTSEYGSFHGSFVAPSGSLTGRMTIKTPLGSTSIQVEEYKRPTFEAQFDTLSGDYALGDSVTVSGFARSFAGANLDNVEVRYRVVRQVRFPYWYFWFRPAPSSPAQEIAQGTLRTQADGSFEIDFVAQPDPTVPEDQQPVFTYQITAEVIDISGETHSAETSVRLGYVGLDLGLRLSEQVNQTQPGNLTLSTRNLNGSFVPTEGSLRILRLDAPAVAFRARKWEQPDQYLISEQEYRTKFPHDLYANESDSRTWDEGKTVFAKTLNSGEQQQIALDFLKQAEPGRYRAVFTTAKDSLTVQEEFTLFAPKSELPALPTWLEVSLSQSSAEPGETVQIFFTTSEPELYVRYEIWHDKQRLRQAWRKLARGTNQIKFRVSEAHRGGLTVYATAFRENQFLARTQRISVPWTNKQLSLRWETFRSPLLPGQEEQWKLTISGSQADQVAAEMVATLYDASLETFVAHDWGLSLYGTRYGRLEQSTDGFGSIGSNLVANWEDPTAQPYPSQGYDELRWMGYMGRYYGRGIVRSGNQMAMMAAPSPRMAGAMEEETEGSGVGYFSGEIDAEGEAIMADSEAVKSAADDDSWQAIDLSSSDKPEKAPDITPRTNLNETAFFFPDLQTNEKGEVVLTFTIPEALTRWRFLGLAHTQDMQVGQLTGETVTQKELMVTPNLPRFFREGDQIQLSAKLNNLSDSALSGQAYLELFDALSMQPVDAAFGNDNNGRAFEVAADGSAAVNWSIEVPETVQAVAVRITAQAGDFTDGEERMLPILSNRMLVTESLPFFLKGKENKQFTFDKLLASDQSETLQQHQLTLDITENPAWYAVQSLPYLMEYPYECTEQIFSRYYANSLATYVANSTPRIQQVFQQWRDLPESEALLSQLETNQDLKSALLAETPWVLDAASDRERKKRIGLLFDLNRMAQETQTAYRQLQQRQQSDGAFAWFPGMPSSRYVTQLVAVGLGHLEKLGVTNLSGDPEVSRMVNRAVSYLDGEILKDYQRLQRNKVDLTKNHLSTMQVQYLYMRSFFPSPSMGKGEQKAYDYYYGQAEEFWPEQSAYLQGMLALTFHRKGDGKLTQTVAEALLENTTRTSNRGWYWQAPSGWFWYQAPIERQSLLIEAFHEIGGYDEAVEQMNIWLIQQKRTQNWGNTRATVEACNALLMSTDWAESHEPVAVKVAGQSIEAKVQAENPIQAGTGAYQVTWQGSEVEPEMGQFSVDNPNDGPAWGAMHWQYFEDLDQITSAETPLSLRKQLYRKVMVADGPQLTEIDADTPLKPGDLITVRVEMRVDRAMNYVHLKDMRAAGFEPMETLSGYEYKSGLGYYRSIRDASHNFFFETLPQGTWVLEYDLRVNLPGTFSNGIATLQCFYAPEYNSHSAGMTVEVE